jgi:sec-independent protein translocase protein TatA
VLLLEGTDMNFGDLFDSPWKVLIIAAVFIAVFGYRRLPDAARSVGRSMRILKAEVSGLHKDDETPEVAPASAAVPPAAAASAVLPPSGHQQQIEDLQQQVRDLQAQAAAVSTATPEAARTQQTS